MVLAEAYANNPKWRRRAEEALRSAIEDSPRDVQPRLMLARLYADLGLPARAAALYREVLEADPGNPTARQEVGATEPLGDGRGSGILGRLFRRP
jgi:cytochrome c-type biogenesis protein CcmH/NrfG